MPQHTLRSLLLGLMAAILLVSGLAPALAARAADDPRFFTQTGYRVANTAFWDYFSHRGGVDTFGYPVSRQVTLQGFPVQFFQRAIMQQGPNGSVRLLNLLDPGLMPYTQINFSRFPAPDEALKNATPRADEPNYDTRIVEFVRANAPDTWNGLPVNFYSTFTSTVTCQDAYPDGDCNEGLLPLLNLELWGAPISAPAYDPDNANFVYQRFQRGIMHYDAACSCTQGILLADYFKGILSGQGLPPDLELQAQGSPYLRQYDPSAPNWVARPNELPATSLVEAFVQESGAPTSSIGYGVNVFASGDAQAAAVMGRVRDMGFNWEKSLIPWRTVEGAGKGIYDWSNADALVRQSNAAGLKMLVRVDFQPDWARRDGANNGPPDNYQDYADFVRALATRYRAGSPNGHIDAIEIWNEVNLSREWGNRPVNQQQAADYVRLLGLSYNAIKAADPSILVITAGLSPTGWNDDTARPDDTYLQWLYDAGMKGKYDALGAHAPGFKAPPEVSPEEAAATPLYGGHRSFTFRRVEDLRAIMERNGDSAKQIWILEFGWTSDSVNPAYAWHRVTEDEKSRYLVRAFEFAIENWTPWIGPMMVWNMPDPTWGPENEMYWWGITNPDGTPRPAYKRLQAARLDGDLP